MRLSKFGEHIVSKICMPRKDGLTGMRDESSKNARISAWEKGYI